MFKKVHRERVDYDLKLLNLYKKDKSFGKDGEIKNGIERNRAYNQILDFCAYKSKERERKVEWAKETLKKYDQQMKNENISYQELIKSKGDGRWDSGELYDIETSFKELRRGIKYTPQTLAKEMYLKEFVPINYQYEYEQIQEQKLDNKEKEQAVEDLKYAKKLELFIITQKTGEELNKEFEKHKDLNIFEEQQIYNKHLDKYKDQAIEILKFGINHNREIIEKVSFNQEHYVIDESGALKNPSRDWEILDILIYCNIDKTGDLEIDELIRFLPKYDFIKIGNY